MRPHTLTLAVAALSALVAVDQLLRDRPALPGTGTEVAPPVESARSTRAALPGRTDPAAFRRGADLPLIATGAEEVRAALQEAGTSVYLPAMLAETDSLIRRWADADADHLRIAFVLEALPGWTAADRAIALSALTEWERIGIGVRFTEVLDTTGAQIVVRWVPRFTFDRTGQADLAWDQYGRIRHAAIQLALADQDGRPLPADALRAVALHEVGHALGLPHSDRPDDLMFPTTRWPGLSGRDTATIRLLYRLPTKSIKWSAPSTAP
ncbi:MAG: matrixin family metalloprotease [Gemmatimonadales bacterium]